MSSLSHLIPCVAMHWYSIRAETYDLRLDTCVKAHSIDHAKNIFYAERPFWTIMNIDRSDKTPLWFWE